MGRYIVYVSILHSFLAIVANGFDVRVLPRDTHYNISVLDSYGECDWRLDGKQDIPNAETYRRSVILTRARNFNNKLITCNRDSPMQAKKFYIKTSNTNLCTIRDVVKKDTMVEVEEGQIFRINVTFYANVENKLFVKLIGAYAKFKYDLVKPLTFTSGAYVLSFETIVPNVPNYKAIYTVNAQCLLKEDGTYKEYGNVNFFGVKVHESSESKKSQETKGDPLIALLVASAVGLTVFLCFIIAFFYQRNKVQSRKNPRNGLQQTPLSQPLSKPIPPNHPHMMHPMGNMPSNQPFSNHNNAAYKPKSYSPQQAASYS